MKTSKILKEAAINHALCIKHCALIMALCITSCSTDDLATSEPTTDAPITVTVSDGGFTNANGTRAEENGYTTTFTSGDQIGVFAVKNGEVNELANNICMTCNGTTWTGNLINIPGATYYAYYPYQESLSGDLVPTATDAAGFFANVISNWQVATDQSTYANYTASDLMTAMGTVSGTSLALTMSHQMGLVVVDLPKTVYEFTNTSIPDYSVPTEVTWKEKTPFYNSSDDVYRYIVSPATSLSISGTYNDGGNAFSFTPSVAAGSYNCYAIDGAAQIKVAHTLQVGDFVCMDGTIVPRELGEPDESCGVIFYLGQNDLTDDCSYKDGDGTAFDGIPAGYVLYSEQSYGPSIPYNSSLSNIGITAPSSPSGTTICGYTCTETYYEQAKDNGTASSVYSLAFAKNIENLPSNAGILYSTWYLPSKQEYVMMGNTYDDWTTTSFTLSADTNYGYATSEFYGTKQVVLVYPLSGEERSANERVHTRVYRRAICAFKLK